MMADSYAIHNVTAVGPRRLVENATIVVEDGIIASVCANGPAPARSFDGQGQLCLPGLIDTHSDGVERELSPRPGVRFPVAFALQSFEGRVRAAGVTTIFHGVGFEEDERKERTVEQARDIVEAVDVRYRGGDALIDHRILYRLDARDPDGLAALGEALDAPPPTGLPPFVSFEDHTPGQGQYLDTSYFAQWLMGSRGIERAEADVLIGERIARRDAQLGQRPIALDWLGDRARAGAIRLLAHDPASLGDIDQAVALGASVAEFPTNLPTAGAARAAGLATVMGAPNVLRGGSHAGNVSAEELVANGLCTALASDYMPSALLAAAFRLAERGVVDLPAAVGLVTSGAAEVVGLCDRGSIADGQRGDLILVTVERGWPTVRTTWQASARQLEAIS